MPAHTAPDTDWMQYAACYGMDTDLWFGRPDRYGVDRHDPNDEELAKTICAGCTVREECLDKALDDAAAGEDVDGIWGATTREERKCLARRISRKKCPVCAATGLCDDEAGQVCCGCGLSWPIAAGQPRVNTDTAA